MHSTICSLMRPFGMSVGETIQVVIELILKAKSVVLLERTMEESPLQNLESVG